MHYSCFAVLLRENIGKVRAFRRLHPLFQLDLCARRSQPVATDVAAMTLTSAMVRAAAFGQV